MIRTVAHWGADNRALQNRRRSPKQTQEQRALSLTMPYRVWIRCGSGVDQVWINCGSAGDQLWISCGSVVDQASAVDQAVDQLWISCGSAGDQLGISCGSAVDQLWISCGSAVDQLGISWGSAVDRAGDQDRMWIIGVGRSGATSMATTPVRALFSARERAECPDDE